MPSYSYVCSECKTVFEFVSSMKEWQQIRPCIKCGADANHSVVLDHQGGGVDSQMKEYQMEGDHGTRLYGACYLDHQIAEGRKKHPGTDFVKYNNCWLPRIKHRTHKLKYLKEYGNYVEYD